MDYQAFWCEENIWRLTTDPEVTPGERWVVLLTGTSGHVACWGQRASGAPEAPVLWDYHVVLAVRHTTWDIWDLDCRLGCPVPAMAWLAATFPNSDTVRPALRPRFLLIPADEFRMQFTSDRAHMRTADGGWQQPPPPWSAPCASHGTTLAMYVERARRGLYLHDLTTRFSSRAEPR